MSRAARGQIVARRWWFQRLTGDSGRESMQHLEHCGQARRAFPGLAAMGSRQALYCPWLCCRLLNVDPTTAESLIQANSFSASMPQSH